MFKVRQARACEVLHGTAGAAGHNSIGLPIHYLVGMAARGDGSDGGGGGGAAQVGGARALAQGLLSDGLSRGQRSLVLSAFRDDL